jgi:hypothetical protein
MNLALAITGILIVAVVGIGGFFESLEPGFLRELWHTLLHPRS